MIITYLREYCKGANGSFPESLGLSQLILDTFAIKAAVKNNVKLTKSLNYNNNKG